MIYCIFSSYVCSFSLKTNISLFDVVEHKDCVNPGEYGTKCGAVYKLTVAPGQRASVYWKLERKHLATPNSLSALKEKFAKKRKEVQSYYLSVSISWTRKGLNL